MISSVHSSHVAKTKWRDFETPISPHRSEQKIARFRTHYSRDVICIREYSNLAKFNTFLLNHLWEIGPVENDLKEIC